MNISKLKRFAPECRTQLIEQVGVKLDYVLTAKTPDLAEKEALLKELRRALDKEGREALIERVAYIWFNRFAAFRFLDAHNWHPFKMRLVTSAKANEVLPELLQQVRQGVLPEELKSFVPMERVNKLLDGQLASNNPQAEVQRLLVIGVSAYYADLMPFLFDKIDAFTELLLPDDLLTEHSVVSGFITDMADEDCSEVEVLGWLYQFYISEKKDAVMARKKAVPSEDIPAVTQLFTPHWIVRYLVENSLGRLWLNSRPHSKLRDHMPYYVEDANSSKDEGRGQKAEVGDFSDSSLNLQPSSLTVETPEEIRLLDPACGSGHMLTYAFDLLVKIYEEEGHAPSEIPEKILTHNLFGLEICPRAAQLASFALVCKAREQSRRAFRNPVQPQVMCLRDVVLTPLEVKGFTDATGTRFSQDELAQLHQFREHTETFGALIQPVLEGEQIVALKAKIGVIDPYGDAVVETTRSMLRLVLDQAEMLSQRYQVVVLNPPYLNKFAPALKTFIENEFKDYKNDLFAAFIVRAKALAVDDGLLGLMTPFVWMFISSYKKLRANILNSSTLTSLVELEYSGFDGATVPICTFTIENGRHPDYEGAFIRLANFRGHRNQGPKTLEAIRNPECGWFFRASGSDLKKIPDSPIAYNASNTWRSAFSESAQLGSVADPRKGMVTADNPRFIREWFEVANSGIGFGCPNRPAAAATGRKWFPYQKGGDYRKWEGNESAVVNWENDGRELLNMKSEGYKVGSTNHNLDYIFKPSIVWTKITSSVQSFRYSHTGCLFDDASGLCPSRGSIGLETILGFLNSPVALSGLRFINPTLNLQPGNLASLPFREAQVCDTINLCRNIARADWDNFETSWDFRDLPLLRSGNWEVESGQPGGAWKGRTLADSWANYAGYCAAAIRRMQELETENNRLWIDVYGLQDELTPEVPEDEITLARADKKKDVASFLSYAVGCMMGRYSLDHPGLILADAGDTLERYLEKLGKSKEEVSFLPDEDAIIPITEDEWFEDDAAARVREFLRVTFGTETLEENLAFIKDALGKDLRKYFTANTGGFYADHVQTYKKRPIYWMFESPKKHFRALVYLHRYTKDTANKILNGYLREFRHKLTHRREELEQLDATGEATAADRKALKKTLEAIKDVEAYERDILLPLAQQRLEIDLDDGVKANYPKFGKALAKVTGLS